jgi:hypothetical protein
MKDLIALVSDKNMEAVMRGILARNKSLGIRPIAVEILVHPGHDSGCLRSGHELLLSFSKRFLHSLIMFDREGCGRESEPRESLESQVENQLSQSGWEERAAAITIDPELEAWVWSDSPHVARVLGWDSGLASLRTWLTNHDYRLKGNFKPTRPKEAMEEILRLKRVPRSPAIYLRLLQSVSFDRCRDESFLKLRRILASWFPNRAEG